MSTATAPGTRAWKLSPSDFSFLWQECTHCFYQKVRGGSRRPSGPMPSIFTKIAAMEKSYFDQKHTKDIHPELPSGVVAYGEKFVKSIPITFPGLSSSCFISGRFDNVVQFDDGTYGVIDFKTSEPSHVYGANYGRQLHAYTYALEHPAPGALALSPVSRLGLLCLEPHTLLPTDDGQFHLTCRPTWIEVERDDGAFLDFVREMLSVLDLPNPPDPSPTCKFCQYRSSQPKASG